MTFYLFIYFFYDITHQIALRVQCLPSCQVGRWSLGDQVYRDLQRGLVDLEEGGKKIKNTLQF